MTLFWMTIILSREIFPM